LVVGEFAVLHDEAGKRLWGGDTTEWGASFYAAIADRVYRHGILHVNEWAQTTAGIPHPRTRVIAMLDDMAGGRRLAVDVEAGSQADCGAIASRKGESIHVLVYNHRPLRKPKVPETVRLRIEDSRMKAGAAWRATEWLLDADQGVWARTFDADFEAAGLTRLPVGGRYEGALGYTYGAEGAALFRKNLAKYAQLAEVPRIRGSYPVVVVDGSCAMDWEMPGHSVRLLRLDPPEFRPSMK
jgi:xylan 1,4-beta-xylosidase